MAYGECAGRETTGIVDRSLPYTTNTPFDVPTATNYISTTYSSNTSHVSKRKTYGILQSSTNLFAV